mgnify:CR=1 FL=1
MEEEEEILNRKCLSIEDVLLSFRKVFNDTGKYKPSPGQIRSKLLEIVKKQVNNQQKKG